MRTIEEVLKELHQTLALSWIDERVIEALEILANKGGEVSSKKPICPLCNGAGKVYVELDRRKELHTCTVCKGTGSRDWVSANAVQTPPAAPTSNPEGAATVMENVQSALQSIAEAEEYVSDGKKHCALTAIRITSVRLKRITAAAPQVSAATVSREVLEKCLRALEQCHNYMKTDNCTICGTIALARAELDRNKEAK